MPATKPESPADRVIMVIDSGGLRARNLKELIQFMDVPSVCIAAPDNWRSRLGDRRLAAVFVRKDLARNKIDRLMQDIGELDPNVPIVLVDGVRTDA